MHSGQFLQITCTVTEGDLPIDIKWQLNEIYHQDFPEVTTTRVGKRISMLAIESVSYAHAGNYTCIANNSVGEAVYTTELQVNGYLLMFIIFFSKNCFRFLPVIFILMPNLYYIYATVTGSCLICYYSSAYDCSF